MRTTTRLVTVALTVTALVLPGMAVGAAPGQGGTAAAAPQSITWTPCGPDLDAECGTLSVPVDWANPGGQRFDVALARRKATDPSARIGSLVVNPGGPGGSGVDFVIHGYDYFSAELKRRFDIVGLDPRGVGQSSPVRCSIDLLRQQPSPVLTSQADFDRVVEYNRRLYADCRANTGPVFDHADTLSVVRDLDALRASLGDARLTFYGVSYGTLIAQQYAETFPNRVRALALDSNMDHSLGTAGFLYTEAWTAQDSFNEFVKGCSASPACALYGRNIRAVWADLLARAARGELPDPTFPEYLLTPLDLIDIAFGSFYEPDWFGLAEFLAAAEAGTPLLTANAKDFQPKVSKLANVGPTSSGYVPGPELAENPFQAVFCEDWSLPVRNYAEYAAHAWVQNLIAPDMRYSPLALFATVSCIGWPSAVNNPQHPLRVRNAPKLLLTNALHDPATGYPWAVNAALQLGGQARLNTYEGWGHGVYGRSECTTGTVDRYLTAGTLPAVGSRCAAVPVEPPAAFGARKAAPAYPRPGGPRW